MRFHRSLLAVLTLVVLCSGSCGSSTLLFAAQATPQPRTTYIISDLHFGLGKLPSGEWNATEDFRWPNALRGFLNDISTDSDNAVDLVIAGDFLELWQPPDGLCKGDRAADQGCTVEEAVKLVALVTQAHRADLRTLAEFAARGSNRLYVIPGNHDAALSIPDVWQVVARELNADLGRVILVSSGVWTGFGGRVLVEHGHQIGMDVNKFSRWPSVTKESNGKRYLERPWGEQFVQQLFNEQEFQYSSIIDNLNPESAGAALRMKDRGFVGTAEDVARFIAFSLFQTTIQQKAAFVGGGADGKDWDVSSGRGKGYLLFADALPAEDGLRRQILSDASDAAGVRKSLTVLSQAIPEADVNALCDQIALRHPLDTAKHCTPSVLGGQVMERFLIPRKWTLEQHLESTPTHKKARVFIYGHTHQKEKPWKLEKLGVTVANTGAFQRLLTEDELVSLSQTTSGMRDEVEALKKLTPNQLKARYGVLKVSREGDRICVRSFDWLMEETDKTGRLQDDTPADEDLHCRSAL